MYYYNTTKIFDKKSTKMFKKNKKTYKILLKKMEEITSFPKNYKNW